ncbi:MAG: permease-like cell division protein FtsX [Anaerovoracaceae bacterium]
MFIRGIGHAIKQAFIQLFRNRAMSFASLFSITAMLLILGLFFILIVNVNVITESAKKQFDTIQIYLLDETDGAAAVRMIDELSEMDGVAQAWYLSKEDAMAEYKLKWGDKGYLLDGFTENPLPNSIRIKLSDLEKADAVVERAKTFAGIEDIKYYKTAVDKLLKVTNYIRIGAMVIIFSLVVVSVVVVANTIKLTVLARAREINIMKYVGANNWFIRGPFLVEGMLIGFISAALSAGLIALVYNKIMELFGTDMFLMFSVRMVPEGFLIENLIMIFTALGVCIGAFGSIISMRRFLDT